MSTEAEPPPDSVSFLPSTAHALDGLVCPVFTTNADLPSMAWLLLVLRELPDDAARFPHGKWATIQRLEGQLTEAAAYEARRLGA